MRLKLLSSRPLASAVALCSLGTLCAVSASAGIIIEWPVADGGNGHFYQAVPAPRTTWVADRDAAANSTYNGMTGHLATFNTASEQSWVTAALGGAAAINIMWLGGFQDFADPDYSEPAGGWKWITGEPFVLNGADAPAWSFNDAYYTSGGERYICTWWSTGGLNDFNDIAGAADVAGYIVEFTPVPEPAALTLLGIGATSLLFRRRRA